MQAFKNKTRYGPKLQSQQHPFWSSRMLRDLGGTLSTGSVHVCLLECRFQLHARERDSNVIARKWHGRVGPVQKQRAHKFALWVPLMNSYFFRLLLLMAVKPLTLKKRKQILLKRRRSSTMTPQQSTSTPSVTKVHSKPQHGVMDALICPAAPQFHFAVLFPKT